jgi:hypothetical protein
MGLWCVWSSFGGTLLFVGKRGQREKEMSVRTNIGRESSVFK